MNPVNPVLMLIKADVLFTKHAWN